jgi:hypothetical protein
MTSDALGEYLLAGRRILSVRRNAQAEKARRGNNMQCDV